MMLRFYKILFFLIISLGVISGQTEVYETIITEISKNGNSIDPEEIGRASCRERV